MQRQGENESLSSGSDPVTTLKDNTSGGGQIRTRTRTRSKPMRVAILVLIKVHSSILFRGTHSRAEPELGELGW